MLGKSGDRAGRRERCGRGREWIGDERQWDERFGKWNVWCGVDFGIEIVRFWLVFRHEGQRIFGTSVIAFKARRKTWRARGGRSACRFHHARRHASAGNGRERRSVYPHDAEAGEGRRGEWAGCEFRFRHA